MSVTTGSWVLAAIATVVGVVACGAPASPREQEGKRTMTPQLAGELATVRHGRIFFSHHSVGANILEGIARLDAEAGEGRLAIVQLDGSPPPSGSVLLHASGGQNGDPVSKIDYFAATLRANPQLAPDLAFMKFCYVDFAPTTDVDAIFTRYLDTLQALKRDFPRVRFAHVTAPLMKRPDDLKSKLRRVLGKEVWEDAANAKRADYNRRVLETFRDDPVFDLAGVESTGTDGEAIAGELRGRRLPTLNPEYTNDGGHLNATGQRVVGAAAVRFLAGALAAGPAAP